MSNLRVLLPFAAASIAFSAVGCGGEGPELASVEGTVKLGGQPLDAAKVVFTPVGPGRPASARTDASGHYELVYSRDDGGAMLGEHTVSISTHTAGDPDSGTPGSPERVPARYNVRTELKKTVESGGNVIDFDLDLFGKIIEPKE